METFVRSVASAFRFNTIVVTVQTSERYRHEQEYQRQLEEVCRPSLFGARNDDEREAAEGAAGGS